MSTITCNLSRCPIRHPVSPLKGCQRPLPLPAAPRLALPMSWKYLREDLGSKRKISCKRVGRVIWCGY